MRFGEDWPNDLLLVVASVAIMTERENGLLATVEPSQLTEEVRRFCRLKAMTEAEHAIGRALDGK